MFDVFMTLFAIALFFFLLGYKTVRGKVLYDRPDPNTERPTERPKQEVRK